MELLANGTESWLWGARTGVALEKNCGAQKYLCCPELSSPYRWTPNAQQPKSSHVSSKPSRILGLDIRTAPQPKFAPRVRNKNRVWVLARLERLDLCLLSKGDPIAVEAKLCTHRINQFRELVGSDDR